MIDSEGVHVVHRRPLLAMLARYRELHPEESEIVDRVDALVSAHPDCFERSCTPGHITASALVVSPDRRRFLLTHHRKLGRWLQLGGHADGDPDPLRVALREAREESGLSGFTRLDPPGAPPAQGVVPVDVDVHGIPARPGEPAHEHHDVRFAFRADADGPLGLTSESIDLRWFRWEELEDVAGDGSLLRLGRKVRRIVGSAAHRYAEGARP